MFRVREQNLRRFCLGVEVREFFDVELSVAVLVELLEQHDDLARREVERMVLQDGRRLLQRDIAVAVAIVLLELWNDLHLSGKQDSQRSFR